MAAVARLDRQTPIDPLGQECARNTLLNRLNMYRRQLRLLWPLMLFGVTISGILRSKLGKSVNPFAFFDKPFPKLLCQVPKRLVVNLSGQTYHVDE